LQRRRFTTLLGDNDMGELGQRPAMGLGSPQHRKVAQVPLRERQRLSRHWRPVYSFHASHYAAPCAAHQAALNASELDDIAQVEWTLRTCLTWCRDGM